MGLFDRIKSLFSDSQEAEIKVDESAIDWADLLWGPVKDKLSAQVDVKMSVPKGKPYAHIKSQKFDKALYAISYSIRTGEAIVSFEIFGGLDQKASVESIMVNRDSDNPFKDVEAKQGVKNKEKWSWALKQKTGKDDDELIDWFLRTVLKCYNFLESADLAISAVAENTKAAAEKEAVEKAAAEAKAAMEKARAEAERELAKAKAEAEATKKAAEAQVRKLKEEAEKAKAEAEAKAAAEKSSEKPGTTKAGKKDGELPGVFVLKDGRKICFSQGNLQFHCKNYEFRFAEEQYETLGKEANEKCAPNYDGWIDIFGWGTSGYMGCQPTERSVNENDYGPSTGDLTGENANYDWGVYNPISNGSNKEGLWRTPTKEEMEYLLKERPNAAKLKLLCTVCGHTGLMLMPDDFWSNRLRISIDITSNSCDDNKFSAEQWGQLESLGVVFFPKSFNKYRGKYSLYPYDTRWLENEAVKYLTSQRNVFYGREIMKLAEGGSSIRIYPVRLIKDLK